MANLFKALYMAFFDPPKIHARRIVTTVSDDPKSRVVEDVLDAAMVSESRPPFVVKFRANPADVDRIVDAFAGGHKPSSDSDEVAELTIVTKPYDPALFTVFREGEGLGLRIDSEGPGGQSWLDEQGFRYQPVLCRFPVSTLQLKKLMLAVLREFFDLDPRRELIAADDDNPDAWREEIPHIAAMDSSQSLQQ